MSFKFGKSKIFELKAKDDVSFYIHKDILTHQSQPFSQAVNGMWKETTERIIDLSDWDEDTVARLVQFLYTGDYDCPDPEPIVMGAGSNMPTMPPSEPETTDMCVLSEHRMPPGNTPVADNPSTPSDTKSHPEWIKQFDPTLHDFKNMLLSHGKVYALAHYKTIDALESLARRRVADIFTHIHPYFTTPRLCGTLVGIAKFVYANTDSLSQSKEPLRYLTAYLAACNIVALQQEPEFVELFAAGGDFATDILGLACQRISMYQTGGTLDGFETRFISGLRVVLDPKPLDRVLAIDNSSSNLNYPNVETLWVVPEYTLSLDEACTAFKLTYGDDRLAGNIAAHRAGTFVYIDPVKEQQNKQKITAVALIRFGATQESQLDITQFDGMTGDIKATWPHTKSQLHLLWRTCKVTNFEMGASS